MMNSRRHWFLAAVAVTLTFCSHLVTVSVAEPLTVPPLPTPEAGSDAGTNLPSETPSELVHSPQEQISSTQTSPNSVEVAGGSINAPHYWFVSTRRCNQRNAGCPVCCYDVFEMQPNRCVRRATMEELLASIRPETPVNVMTHGSFVDWNSISTDAWYTYFWLRRVCPNRSAHFIFFTWPSDRRHQFTPFRTVNGLGMQSEFNAIYLAQFLHRIPTSNPLNLIGHSHGARTVTACLHLMGGGSVQNYCLGYLAGGRRIRAILAAAAMDHDRLNPGERYHRALYAAECVLSFYSRHDFVLGTFRLRKPFANRAMGKSGFTASDRRKLGWLSRKTFNYDVTRWVGFGHIWSHYYTKPGLAHALIPYVYFTQ